MEERVLNLTEEEQALLDATIEEAHSSKDSIPENSPTLLIDESTSRFSSAIWFEAIKDQQITLVGLGGIGSYVAYLLGRLQVKSLSLYDDDVVDSSNLSGQFYPVSSVGQRKVDSTFNSLVGYSNYYKIYGFSRKFTASESCQKIMICGLDNMSSRRTCFLTWLNRVNKLPVEERASCLFIDGRLAAEEFQVFCMRGNDAHLVSEYADKWLFDDKEAEETLCSYKQTSFCANMIASVIVNLFVNFVANMCQPLIDRELPFFTYYNAENMFFKTK